MRSLVRPSLMHGGSHVEHTAPPNLFLRAPRGQSHYPTSSLPPLSSARAWSISLFSSSTSIRPEHFSLLSSTYSGVPYLPSEVTLKHEYSTRCTTSHKWAESSSDRITPRRKICSRPTGRYASTRHSLHTDNAATAFVSVQI